VPVVRHHRVHRRRAGTAVVQAFVGVGSNSIQFAAMHAPLHSCHFVLSGNWILFAEVFSLINSQDNTIFLQQLLV
jgi:hypothetical protein